MTISEVLTCPPVLTDEQREQLRSGFATILPPEEIYKLGWIGAMAHARRALNVPARVSGELTEEARDGR